jgi:uncharacterized protein YkwD
MLAGVALLCACTIPAGPPPPAPVPVPAAPAPDTAADAIARDLLAEVNRTREAHGPRALRRDSVLDRAASEHALELAERRTLDHVSTDPGRRTVTTRIEAAGGTWSRAAERGRARVTTHVRRSWLADRVGLPECARRSIVTDAC